MIKSHLNIRKEGDGNVIERNSIYSVQKSELLGRYLVASRNINAGEKIIEEDALIVGPKNDSKIICLGCYRKIDYANLKQMQCKRCKWPICGDECIGLGARYGHLLDECELLTKIAIDTKSCKEIEQLYSLITPLRCLLLKINNVQMWNLLCTLEAHNEIRKVIDDIWNFNQFFIVNQIRLLFSFNQFTDTEIHTICGILEVNAYEIGQGDISIRALYLKSSMMAHSCIPNTSHIDYSNFKMIIRSSVTIPKNHMITMSYTNTLDSTYIRRENLKMSKFFDCKCPRCSDSTELGTFISALKCPICKTGKVIPKDPLNQSIWICSNVCSFQMLSTDVYNLVHKLKTEFKLINSDDIETYERFLSKHNGVLHENHSINLEINYILSQLYGKISNYIINEMPNNLLERKRNLCVDLLKIFDVIDPGQSRLRGVTLYELHAPLMILALRQYEAKQITKRDLAKEFDKIKTILNEVVVILKNEPDESTEKQLSIMAKTGLSQMQNWNKFFKSK